VVSDNAAAHNILDGGLAMAAQEVRAGRCRLPELVEASLERIEAGAYLNAFTSVYRETARRLAEAHQGLLDNGYDLGPLHGLPIALKDNIGMAGVPMTAGSKILGANLARDDAQVVTALKRAGAIVMGHTNMHEFAWGGTTDNPHYGSTKNAWGVGRSPAGSSGGAGSALAARMVMGAIGTDTGGSIRNPASVSGVSGIRPTFDRVSTRGVFPLAWSLDAVGPMALSSQDCAILLESIARPTASGKHDEARSLLSEIERPLTGLRVGWIDDYAIADVQTAVRDAFENALEILKGLGAAISPVAIPNVDGAVDALVVINSAEPSALHARWIRERPEDYGDDVRRQLIAGSKLSAVDYIQAQRFRTHLSAQFAHSFLASDVIVTPTLPFAAPAIGDRLVDVGGRDLEIHTTNMRFTALASITALPAMSVPMGFADGLPLGLQIIAPAFADGLALRVGHQYQLVTHHHLQKPEAPNLW
jgi:aspartyl-tRNA(Asn)/glutamyl-tRNA(Gln) amidotransferase subunit A